MSDTIKTAKDQIKVLFDLDIPSYLHGPPGCGKSEAYQQCASELRVGFRDLRLGQMDPVDLRGLPGNRTVDEILTTSWARPDFWPIVDRDGERGILLFDEMSDCGKAMQSAAYQVILNRRAGPHVIPPGWWPCAAGNRREDRAAAQSLSTALANRFAHIMVVPDVEAFYDYGTVKSFHHFVLGFIKHRPNLLHSMEGADQVRFPTPRGWERVSKICNKISDTALLFKLVMANVGEGAAGEFMAYHRTLDLPDIEEIIRDPSRCRIPNQPGSKYAMTCYIARWMDRKNIGSLAKYIARSDYGRDFEICCMLDATHRDASLCETKAFIDFANRNKDLQL